MAVSPFTASGAPLNSNTTTQTSVPLSAITLPTSGGQDVLAVALVAVSGTPTAETATCTDNLGNTWTVVAIANSVAGSAAGHTLVAFRNFPASGSDTVVTPTVTLGTAVNMRFAVGGYVTGHDPASPLDTSGTAVGIVSTTSLAVSTGAAAAAGGLALAVWSGTGTSPAATGGYPGSWTGIQNLGDATRARAAAFMQQQLAASGVVTAPTLTFASSQVTPAYSVVVFKAPGAPLNTVAPVVSGTLTLGSTLTVSDGTWSPAATGFTYQWQRSSDGGTTWKNISAATSDGGNTSNTHTVVGFDVGSIVRCVVTASNASGSSAANSNSTAEVAPPSGAPSWRRVSHPATQSDNQIHSVDLAGAVLPGETLVLLASTSVGTISGDMGSVTDPNGNVWTLDHDTGGGAGVGHITQVFSAQNGATKLNLGATITNKIKQAVVVGAHAQDSPTITLDHNPGFDPAGTALNIGLGSSPAKGTITYTGISGSTLQGVSAHPALVDGDVVVYHGQSPYYAIYALNPGDGSGSRLALDGAASQHVATQTPSAGPITTTKAAGVAFTLAALGTGDTNHWMVPGSGWTVDFHGFFANHLTGGASDADGITYGGESSYKVGVQARTYSAAGTSITGNYTSDAGIGAAQDTLLVAYGFNPAGGGGQQPGPPPGPGGRLRGLRSHRALASLSL